MAIQDSKTDSIIGRIRKNPAPAARWGAVMFVLVAVEFGALWGGIMALPWDVPFNKFAEVAPSTIASVVTGVVAPFANVGDWLSNLPTLLSRDIIPNRGYHVPGEGWQGTFLGLSPDKAWVLRVGLVYAYALLFCYWTWRGYFVFRRHYRYADWTPADDMIDRFRSHNWGKFGLLLVVLFVVMAVFAPTVSPTTNQDAIQDPYSHTTKFYNEDTESVQEVTQGQANLFSASKGDDQNVGMWTYDDYDRFHPAGTITNGKDLFTFMAFGSRISLFIGLFASVMAGGIALALALLSAYYKGLVDLITVLTSDAFAAMPRLLVLIMLVTVLADHWLMDIYSGGFLIALLFGIWGWMGLWRSVRGPAFQIVENEWVMASKGFGETPWRIMRRHVAPYIIGYLLIYLSMSLGGYILGAAGLSFLGLGVTAPTPEMGRAVANGQDYINSASWHISVVPGIAISLLVLGFNALGDGVRDAIDPKADSDDAAGEAAAAGGGA